MTTTQYFAYLPEDTIRSLMDPRFLSLLDALLLERVLPPMRLPLRIGQAVEVGDPLGLLGVDPATGTWLPDPDDLLEATHTAEARLAAEAAARRAAEAELAALRQQLGHRPPA